MEKSGWYYDDQVNNVMTSVTLHSNMWWETSNNDNPDKGKWVKWSDHGDVDSDSFVKLVGLNDSSDKNPEGVCGYGIIPIARSILTEDFNVSVYNTWTDFGEDFLSGIWNQVRQAAPYVKNLSNSMDVFREKNNNLKDKTDVVSKLMYKAGNLIEGAADFISVPNAVQYLNKALVTQGTRFSYYGGTGFSFGNLGMKFTIFPKYEGGKIITVVEQMENLYPYIIGKLEPFELKVKIKNGETHDSASLLGDEYKDLLQWQSPPGGFESELKYIDIIQKGTLKLKIGPHYCLTNLVCQEANFSFSKQMVKFPSPDNTFNNNKISPLFCDVALTLKPVTLYSDIMMRKFVSGKGTYVDEGSNKIKVTGHTISDKEIEKLPYDSKYTKSTYNKNKDKNINEQLKDSLDNKTREFVKAYREYK